MRLGEHQDLWGLCCLGLSGLSRIIVGETAMARAPLTIRANRDSAGRMASVCSRWRDAPVDRHPRWSEIYRNFPTGYAGLHSVRNLHTNIRQEPS